MASETGGVFARTDVADEASVQAAVDAAAGTGVPLRVAVSCAGIGWAARTVGRDGTPHDLAAYQRVINVNLIGTFNLMRIAAAAIARTEPADGDGQRGVIINTSSIAGIEGQTGQIAYSASKGGIIGMTLPAARDLSAIGVRVNTICPGIIDTPIYGSGAGRRGVQGPAGGPGRLPQAHGAGGRIRSPGAEPDRERLPERGGRPLRRRDQVPAQVMTSNVRLLSDLLERALSGLPRQAGPSPGRPVLSGGPSRISSRPAAARPRDRPA